MDQRLETPTPAPRGFRHWQSLSDGFLLSLVVVGPAFLFEELWRGKPMIDQGGMLWLIPALIMTAGFFAGGRVAGRNRSTQSGAFTQGLLVAGLTLGMIFVADMIRRLILTQALSWTVIALWVSSALGALLVAGLGGINGRRGLRLARQRYQMERFH